MPDEETNAIVPSTAPATVPDHVEHGGLIWNLINRGNGTWGIQQGLSHQGELVHEREGEAETRWRVVTKTIPYTEPDVGFETWDAAIEHFLTAAGPAAIDGQTVVDGDPVVGEPLG